MKATKLFVKIKKMNVKELKETLQSASGMHDIKSAEQVENHLKIVLSTTCLTRLGYLIETLRLNHFVAHIVEVDPVQSETVVMVFPI